MPTRSADSGSTWPSPPASTWHFKPTFRTHAWRTKRWGRQPRHSEDHSISAPRIADVGDAKVPIALRLGRQETRLRRAAPHRVAALGEHRTELGRGAGHPAHHRCSRSTSSARHSCAASPTTSTRAGTAIGWQGPTRPRPSWCRVRPSSRMCSGAATSICSVSWASRARSRRRRSGLGSPVSCPHAWTTASRWPCSEEASTRTPSARGQAIGSCVHRCPGGQRRSSPPNTTSRPATRTRPTASRQTFDQLYPTGHDKLGLVRSGRLAQHPSPSRRASRSHRSRRRPSLSTITRGGWRVGPTVSTAASGALVARVAGGAVNTHVGQEIDFLVSRAITPAAPTRRWLRAHLQRRVPA